ncbi:hypothetical protein ATDW_21010 [Asticcacaulis sp. DW145]|uniref:hypothetical protein n=1 Tax=Asticcacaulis sp. DW145 TaxID=3095608 RepID=UPI003091BD29|nr:hypothetical protein ATDW_21010 [Asticcacaulis sp. DW145]
MKHSHSPALPMFVLDWRTLERSLLWLVPVSRRNEVANHISTLMELSLTQPSERITAELIVRIGILMEAQEGEPSK